MLKALSGLNNFLQPLLHLVSRISAIGHSDQETDASNRITAFANLMVVFGILVGVILITTAPLIGMPLFTVLPLLALIPTGGLILLLNHWGLLFISRLISLILISSVGWKVEIFNGPTFHGTYMFFVSVFFSVVAFSRYSIQTRMAVITLAASNFYVADWLYHGGFDGLAGLGSRDFPIQRLWINTSLYVGLITVLLWVEKTRADRHELSLRKALDTISEEKQKIQIVFDSINQGVFVIDSNLEIEPDFSAGARELFPESKISGESVIDLLFGNSDLSQDQRASIKSTMDFCIGEDIINWEINKPQLPDQVTLAGEKIKILSLSWSPLVKDDVIQKVILGAEDITEKLMQELADKKKKQREEINLTIFSIISKVGLDFARDFVESVQSVGESLKNLNTESAPQIKRDLHSLKGESRMLDLKDWSGRVHQVEERVIEWQKSPFNATVDKEIQSFIFGCDEVSSVGCELIQQLSGGEKTAWSLYQYLFSLKNKINQQLASTNLSLDSLTFRDGVSEWPQAYQRSLQIILLHSLQNAVDHGYLLPGLNENVNLNIWTHETEKVYQLVIEDFGNGLNMDALEDKLKVLPSEVKSQLRQATDILFLEDVSTATQVSQTSGRGVGLSAVKYEVELHGGELSINNCEEHRGTCITISLPKHSVTVSQAA